MAKKRTVSFETVRSIGLLLPGVEESTCFGKPALKVRGQMFVCLPSHRSAEPDSLVARLDFEQRAELLAIQPDLYYITDHYRDYPSVLVRLGRVSEEILTDLVATSHRYVSNLKGTSRKRK